MRSPDMQLPNIVQKNRFTYFEDIKWAFFDGKMMQTQKVEALSRDVMNSNIVKK
jgi:hypothetical protein